MILRRKLCTARLLNSYPCVLLLLAVCLHVPVTHPTSAVVTTSTPSTISFTPSENHAGLHSTGSTTASAEANDTSTSALPVSTFEPLSSESSLSTAITGASAAPIRKVFGVGLSKTGSTSLGAALTELGYRNIHNDRGFAPFLSPPGHFNFSHRYDDVDAVEDLPTAFYYEEMLAEYSDALFVLTIRDPEAWYESYSAHQKDLAVLHGGMLPFRLKALNNLVYGTYEDDKQVWIEHYNAHNKRVQDIIPRDQLLIMDITKGHGWGQLCTFLQRSDGPCSRPDRPFAHENAKEARAQIVEKKIANIDRQANKDKAEKRFAYACLLVTASESPHGAHNMVMFQRAARSIRLTGSKYDIIALVYGTLNAEEEQKLRAHNIGWVFVQPMGTLLDRNYETMMTDDAILHSRARLRVLQLSEYDMVMVFHPNLIFHRNCDNLFYVNKRFFGRTVSNSPFDADLYFVKPSWEAAVDLRDVAHTRGFNPDDGWLDYGPIVDWRSPNKTTDWRFYGATAEQGLLYYYYFGILRGKDSQLVAYGPWESRVVHYGTYHESLNQKTSSLTRMLQWLHLAPINRDEESQADGDHDSTTKKPDPFLLELPNFRR